MSPGVFLKDAGKEDGGGHVMTFGEKDPCLHTLEPSTAEASWGSALWDKNRNSGRLCPRREVWVHLGAGRWDSKMYTCCLPLVGMATLEHVLSDTFLL